MSFQPLFCYNPSMMNYFRTQATNSLVSVITTCLFVLLFFVGLIFFSYLLVIVALISSLCAAVVYIRMKCSERNELKKQKSDHVPSDTGGRIIDHDEVA